MPYAPTPTARKAHPVFPLYLICICIRPTSLRLQAAKAPRNGLAFFFLLFPKSKQGKKVGERGQRPLKTKGGGMKMDFRCRHINALGCGSSACIYNV